MRRREGRWSGPLGPALFVRAWETLASPAAVNIACGCTDASLRADYLRTLGVPLTRFEPGRPTKRPEPRRIAWASPFSVAELERLAALAFTLARGVETQDPERPVTAPAFPVPEEQAHEVRVGAMLVGLAFAEMRERRAIVKENMKNNKRARRAAAVARGLRARDVN